MVRGLVIAAGSIAAVLVAFVGLSVCICRTAAKPEPRVRILSPIDGQPYTPRSVHCGKVRVLSPHDFIVGNAQVPLFFTGGTSPWDLPLTSGTLCASVPGFETEDRGDPSEYYFMSFTPEKP